MIFNVKELLSTYDIVMDCTDNFSTKFLLHDICFFLKKPLVQASVYQLEGVIQVFKNDDVKASCLRCVWETQPVDGCTGSCAEAGVLGLTPAIIGQLQALEVVKLILKLKVDAATKLIDLLSLEVVRVESEHNPQCVLCGDAAEKKQANDVLVELSKQMEIEVFEKDQEKYLPLDIRSLEEYLEDPSELMHMPEIEVGAIKKLTNQGKPVLLVCKRGLRSLDVTRDFRSFGESNVFSFHGGIDSWREL